ARLEAALADYQRKVDEERAACAAQHAEVELLLRQFGAGDPDALRSYMGLVLSASPYPDGFPGTCKIAYVPESSQLVVEYDLPPFEIAPRAAAYKYVKTTDKVTETLMPVTQRRALYASIVAQAALRTLGEVFVADRHQHVGSVVFNGHVETIDPATGRRIRPCLVTVRCSRDALTAIDLSQVDPAACLRSLNASVSKSPAEFAPVRPVLEFSMVDARFVDEVDVLSGLDQRPNLMELTPGEFESLITNLFERMGLETRLTQASRDGGVDCVAYDPRPIFGGKVVIQAKRYKHTVGVSAVRDLFGTMQNEGASKGILVTTSGYGKASFQFADGKPLELLSGSHLLYLLAEHTGIDARIEPPDDWTDPEPDSEPSPS
ncbi:MAG: restriction endonuclease, partial [Actinomycetota bacterium]|nr:restriction endonuclease [Actinomycetota bacterium]